MRVKVVPPISTIWKTPGIIAYLTATQGILSFVTISSRLLACHASTKVPLLILTFTFDLFSHKPLILQRLWFISFYYLIYRYSTSNVHYFGDSLTNGALADLEPRTSAVQSRRSLQLELARPHKTLSTPNNTNVVPYPRGGR